MAAFQRLVCMWSIRFIAGSCCGEVCKAIACVLHHFSRWSLGLRFTNISNVTHVSDDLKTRGSLPDRGTGSLLSGVSVYLLAEFKLRYGLQDIWTLLCRLECFTELFTLTIPMLEELWETVDQLIPLLCDLPAHRCLILHCEKVGLGRTLFTLERLLAQSIRRATHSFPDLDTCRCGMSLLARILARVHQLWPTCIHPVDPQRTSTVVDTGSVLQNLLRDACQLAYERYKFAHSPDIEPDAAQIYAKQAPSPELLHALQVMICQEVQDYVNCYGTVMERWLDVRQVVATEFYQLLQNDVLVLLDKELLKVQNRPVGNPEVRSLRHLQLLIGLATRLAQLDETWLDVVGRECFKWRQRYIQLLCYWIPHLQVMGETMLRQAVVRCSFQLSELTTLSSSVGTGVSTHTTGQPPQLLVPSVNSAFSNPLSHTSLRCRRRSESYSSGNAVSRDDSLSQVLPRPVNSPPLGLLRSKSDSALLCNCCLPVDDTGNDCHRSRSCCVLSVHLERQRAVLDDASSSPQPCSSRSSLAYAQGFNDSRAQSICSTVDSVTARQPVQRPVAQHSSPRRILFRQSSALLDLLCMCARWRALFVLLQANCALEVHQFMDGDSCELEGTESAPESTEHCDNTSMDKQQDWQLLLQLHSELRKTVVIAELRFVRALLNQLIWMDLCGASLAMGRACFGSDELHRLLAVRCTETGGVWTCRHRARDGHLANCLRYFGANQRSEILAHRHEPISHEMCVRLNDLHCLSRLLPRWFSLQQMGGDASDTDSVASCGSLEVDRVQQELLETTRQAKAGFRGAVALLAARLTLFVCDALRLAISDLSGRSEPLQAYVDNHLSALRYWLTPYCCAAVLRQWWREIISAIEKQINSLWRFDGASVERTTQLFLILLPRLLFQFQSVGVLPLEELMGNFGGAKKVCVERLFLKLSLFSWKSHILLGTYLHLSAEADFQASLRDHEENEEYSDAAFLQPYLEEAARHLHLSRKVCSGADFVVYFLTYPPTCLDDFWEIVSEKDAVQLGQHLLNCGALLPVSNCSSSDNLCHHLQAHHNRELEESSSSATAMRLVPAVLLASDVLRSNGVTINVSDPLPSAVGSVSDPTDPCSSGASSAVTREVSTHMFVNSPNVFYRLASADCISSEVFELESIQEELFEHPWHHLAEALRKNPALRRLGSQLMLHKLPSYWPLRVLRTRRSQDSFARRMMKQLPSAAWQAADLEPSLQHQELEDGSCSRSAADAADQWFCCMLS